MTPKSPFTGSTQPHRRTSYVEEGLVMSQATETAFVVPVELSTAAWEAFVGTYPLGEEKTDEALRAAVEAAVATQVRDVQAKVENMGVRAARENSWCGVFNRVMWDAFPAGPLDGQDWRDNEGKACDGSRWLDADGYGRDGFNDSGLDRDGFNRAGRDAAGFDREGKDADGIHRDAPERYRFNDNRIDRDGYDGDGYSPGHTRAQLAAWREAGGYVYDAQGYTVEGLDRRGRNRQGVDRYGFDRNGYHAGTATYYDADGYDASGWNRNTGDRRPDAS